MPDPPKENDENESFQVPPGKGYADSEKKDRRENEAPLKALEERAISVGTDHSWQMVTSRAKCCHEDVDILCAPARLRQSEHRHQQQWCANVKNQITPAT